MQKTPKNIVLNGVLKSQKYSYANNVTIMLIFKGVLKDTKIVLKGMLLIIIF